MHPVNDIESVVRSRLRDLRIALGWSLDELASRTHLSASTISRVETGKRTLSLDVLQTLCRALVTDVSSLLDVSADDDTDVVIRPIATSANGMTAWPLTRNRGNSTVVAAKIRIEPTAPCSELTVHPGHDWFFVLSGAVLLTLGDRDIIVYEGEAADFSTTTPHRFTAHGGPAELLTIFDRAGHLSHLSAVT